jgi:restriction system protein
VPIPDFQAVMLPVLAALADGKQRDQSELVDVVAAKFKMTDQERKALLPSGKQAVVANRVGWARTYMKKAGLLESPSRGTAVITEEGRKLLATKPDRISVSLLRAKYPTFAEFHTYKGPNDAEPVQPNAKPSDETETPQERLERSYEQLRGALAQEVLEKVSLSSPAFFEQLVVDLLVAMGYGGSRQDAGQSIGKSGDEGIDGIIKEDKLGLDVVYVQAKRWSNTVGRPHIQAFAGSLEGHRARKGVFITTSSFSSEAREYVNKIEKKIVLIDGPLLAQLMIDHDVGVAPQRTFTVKRIDADYFEGE